MNKTGASSEPQVAGSGCREGGKGGGHRRQGHAVLMSSKAIDLLVQFHPCCMCIYVCERMFVCVLLACTLGVRLLALPSPACLDLLLRIPGKRACFELLWAWTG